MKNNLFQIEEQVKDPSDPVRLAKEMGVTSQYYANADILAQLLSESIQSGPQMGLLEQGRELPCYIVKIEEFYTPVCYDPPASRQLILAYDKTIDEWLLLAISWFAGVSDMSLPSFLFIDELEMIVAAVKQLSARAKVRIYSAVDIQPMTRNNNQESRMEAGAW
jgi:hypothetical protein